MKPFITLLITAAFMICTSTELFSQMVSITRSKTGLLLSGSAAGTGLTGNFSAGIYRQEKSNLIALELTIPKNVKYISGAQLSFNHDFLNCSDSYSGILGMHLFFTARYIQQTELSKTSIKVIEKLAPEFNNPESIRYRTIEGYTGIGLTAKIANGFTLFTDFGAGYFHTLDKNTNTPVEFTTYKNDSDFSLYTRAGLRIKIKG